MDLAVLDTNSDFDRNPQMQMTEESPMKKMKPLPDAISSSDIKGVDDLVEAPESTAQRRLWVIDDAQYEYDAGAHELKGFPRFGFEAKRWTLDEPTEAAARRTLLALIKAGITWQRERYSVETQREILEDVLARMRKAHENEQEMLLTVEDLDFLSVTAVGDWWRGVAPSDE
ncbi:hypothetical protein [Azotobacter beijerinckii]|uniref:Uncharacterized protein n=1 Tax=Azotobacter beijerinckii TaxID=170623 RepID=A0A1I4FA01_9GAMM|nr:hypothetical protein [Azotobacter beijerinckii]SFB42858.1 hypothetical protein SAMN04244571_02759 [Azotobacter beijerinckii]SFL13221.1 hypothetical protein SAMN04244574_03238 [Azotobacter beijerinckii]